MSSSKLNRVNSCNGSAIIYDTNIVRGIIIIIIISFLIVCVVTCV